MNERMSQSLISFFVAASLLNLLSMILLFSMSIILQVEELTTLFKQTLNDVAPERFLAWIKETTMIFGLVVLSILARCLIKHAEKRILQMLRDQRMSKETLVKEEQQILIWTDLLLADFLFILALIFSIFLQTYDFVLPAYLCLIAGIGFLGTAQRKMLQYTRQGAERRKTK